MNASQGDGEKFFDSLRVHMLILCLFVLSMFLNSGKGVFTDDCLQLSLENALVVVEVVIGRVEVGLLLIGSFLLLLDNILVKVPIADILVEFVDLVRHLLHP